MADSAPRGFVGHRIAALLLGAVVERPSAHHFQHILGRLLTRQGCGQIEKPIGGQCKPMRPNSTSLEPSQVTSFEIDPQSSLVK